MRPVVVAIDGPAGAGKSTVSRLLARRLGYRYVDTGAMYRVIGLRAARQGIALDDGPRLAELCRSTRIEFRERPDGSIEVLANGEDVTAAIRTPEVSQWASKTSAVPEVRKALVEQQRQMGREGGVVMEGRDIGTVVFPEAEVKVFLDASARERARRRAAELHREVTEVEIEQVAREIAERDERDRNRTHAPLRAASDAIFVDTTNRTVDEIVQMLYEVVRRRASTRA